MAEFDELIRRGAESRSLEYKESQSWESLKVRLAKACLAMANIRDGGVIVVGVAQRGDTFTLDGVAEEYLAGYSEDAVQPYVNQFADPFIRIEVRQADMDGRHFVVIRVHQFESVPIICRRSVVGELQSGRIYTRSLRQNGSMEVQNPTEMREIIDLAVEKELTRVLTPLALLGLAAQAATIVGSSRFDEELEGL